MSILLVHNTTQLKMAVFWVVALCRLVQIYQHFRRTASIISAVSIMLMLTALMMEAVQTAETLVNLHQSTQCCNPEDRHF
jgi:uncharacterized protein YhhL (DUF1145 family)